MPRLDHLDPRSKLYISCGLITLLSALLGWWLLAQLGHAQQLAQAALRQDPRAAAAAQGLRAHYSHVLLIGWLGIGVLALGAALLGRWLAVDMTRPLREAAALAVRVAGGDLSSHISRGGAGDEGALNSALHAMNDTLAGLVTQLRSGAGELVRGAGAIASGNAKLAAQAERQLGALRQAGLSATQMSEGLRQSGHLALAAGQSALGNRDAAAGAAALAEQLCGALAGAQQATGRLSALSRTVEDIAFHSQMLALSSAVEAARAAHPHDGSGDGMAMLALDVRLLAQRTGEAARELRELGEQAAAGLQGGTELGERARSSMLEVAAQAQRVAEQVAEAAAAGVRHEAMLDENLQALAGLERTLEEAGPLIGQTAAAAAALRDRGGALLRMLAVFRLTRRPLRSGGHMYLAASNPDLIVRPMRERRGRTCIAAVKP